MKYFIHFFGLLIFSFSLHAKYEITGPFVDRLQFCNDVKSFDTLRAEAVRQGIQEYQDTPYWKQTEADQGRFEKLRNGLDYSLFQLTTKLNAVEKLAPIINNFVGEGEPNIEDDNTRMLYYFLRSVSPETLKNLKKVLPPTLVKDKIWRIVDDLRPKVRDIHQRYEASFGLAQKLADRFYSKDFLSQVDTAVLAMDKVLNDGDILVGVGNTPQFLLEAYKAFGNKKVQPVAIALSGAPGKNKMNAHTFYYGCLTQEGLNNYNAYLNRSGLDLEHLRGKKVFFLDIIGSAGGPEFIIEELVKKVTDSEDAPNFNLLAINTIDNPKQLSALKVDSVSLKMDRLAAFLDRVDNENFPLRTTPNFPSLLWDEWPGDPVLPVGDLAREIIENIKRQPGERKIVEEPIVN